LWVEAKQYKIVGACLAAARRRANVTQQELAGRLGKPQSFVSEYERGQRRVDVVELLAISRALGLDPLEVFAEIARCVGRSDRYGCRLPAEDKTRNALGGASQRVQFPAYRAGRRF
jgi:transcriptional regulator with XRE-family HTH domain